MKQSEKEIEKLIIRQFKRMKKEKLTYDYERFKRELKEVLEKS